jgi:hypothetical protein
MRKYKNVVLSDISEMFLKVILDPADRRYHRFHFNGEEYEWLVILFGNLSSPNGSQKVIQLHCDLNGEGLDEALESVRNACYMEDVAESRPDKETALEPAKQLVILFIHDPHENLETIHRQPVQPDDLQTIHHQLVQPDVQAQANVPADVHNPAANLGAASAEPARQNATIPKLTIEDKIRTFHIPDDEPSGPSQTAPLAQNPDKKIA